MNALGFLKCFVVESCPRSYWASVEAVIPIIAVKALQPTEVSQENVTMMSTPNAGKLSTLASLPAAQSP